MSETVAQGITTGRSAKTYYNKVTRAAPSWNEVAFVAGSESFDAGKENSIQGENRQTGRKVQESGVQDNASLKFTYQRPRGVADPIFDDLFASYVAGGPRYEWAPMDDDITKVGSVGYRFFGKVTGLTWKRDLASFAEYDIEISERAVYESSVLQELIDYEVE